MESLIDPTDPLNQVTGQIIDSAVEIHATLGPGLLESAYETFLCKELSLRGLRFERQVSVPVSYKGENVDVGFRMDLLVEGKVVVELKATGENLPIHRAQLLTYLKLTGQKVGLLLNFGGGSMRQGIQRMVL
jgi:GxxExxY protein